MSSVGTSPGNLPGGNFTGTTNTAATRQTSGSYPAGSSRIANGQYVPSVDTALQAGYGSRPEQATTGPNRSFFSQSAPPSPESLSALQHELDVLSQRLSQLLDSRSHAASAPAVASSRPTAPSASPAVAPRSAGTAAPSESPYPDLGSHPFMSNPTGTGPTGTFSFNPMYFPTQQTAQKIADMLGGKVVPQDAILSSPGSPFKQNQVNYMVELPDGRTINPGFIAQALTSGQAPAMIDAIIYSEATGKGVQPGQAPHFVPVNRPAHSSTTAPPTAGPSATSNSGPAPVIVPKTWFHMDPLQKGTGSVVLNTSSQSDPAIQDLRRRLDQVRQMLQIASQRTTVRSENR